MEQVEYRLEEKMGDGSWSAVYETKEEADCQEPSFKSFPTADLARKYGNEECQRWLANAIDRGGVRIVVVRTTVTPLVSPEKGERSRHYHAKDALLELDYPDSIFDVRLFLTGDGRKRGLWVWLEEDAKIRIENDARLFNGGLKRFIEYLKTKKLDFDKPEHVFDLIFRIKMDFDYFFSHRTEAQAIRLSWKQVKKLAAALNEGHKSEKDKTEGDW